MRRDWKTDGLFFCLAAFGFLSVSFASSSQGPAASPTPTVEIKPGPISPPAIASLLKPNLWKRMIQDKEMMCHASLEDMPGLNGSESEEKRYSFYAAMLVGASVNQSRRVLTDYKLYAQMIPYVDKADYSAESHILLLEGGIWNFKINSEIVFQEMMDRWIRYTIIAGSFRGLSGNIYFESLGERGTAVYFNGEQFGPKWPPRFVIERGAEIVFGFAAGRMRSYIESQKNKLGGGVGNGEQRQGKTAQPGENIPQPRSHL